MGLLFSLSLLASISSKYILGKLVSAIWSNFRIYFRDNKKKEGIFARKKTQKPIVGVIICKNANIRDQ
jgi:hypothetical protein